MGVHPPETTTWPARTAPFKTLRNRFDPDYDRRVAEQARRDLLSELARLVKEIPILRCDQPDASTWRFWHDHNQIDKWLVRVTPSGFEQYVDQGNDDRKPVALFDATRISYDAEWSCCVYVSRPDPARGEVKVGAIEHLALCVAEKLGKKGRYARPHH